MPFQGLDETKLLILMAAGGVFALAGLYLLIKPPKTDGETRIKVFGLEFNASSGGARITLLNVDFLLDESSSKRYLKATPLL